MAVGVAMIGLAAPFVGCQSSNPVDQAYVQTLHSEIRMLEDEIYAIEAEYDQTQRLLAAREAKIAQLEGRSRPGSTSSSGSSSKSSNPLRDLPKIFGLPKSPTPADEPELLPPSLDLGEPSAGSGVRRGTSMSGPRIETDDGSGLSIDLGEFDESFGGEIAPQSYSEPIEEPLAGEDGPGARVRQASALTDAEARAAYDPRSRVTHIVLNPRLTGGMDFNGAPGDDGLFVVVEPRNRDDRYVPAPAEMSLALLDPKEPPETARVARWDLSREEIARRMQPVGAAGEGDSQTDPGIRLKLPWNALPPSHEDLLLFVRYVTPDGRNVEAQAALTIAVAGKTATRWTPRSEDARNAASAASPGGYDRPIPNLPREAVSPRNALPTASEESSSVPTVADLRKETRPQWSAPKEAPAENSSDDASPAKRVPPAPEWKPFR